MTLFLEYNVNNHILDDAHFLWWPSALPYSESVFLLSKGLLNLEPPFVWLHPCLPFTTYPFWYTITTPNLGDYILYLHQSANWGGFGKCSGPHLPHVGKYFWRLWVIVGLSGIKHEAHFYCRCLGTERIWSEGHFCPFKLFLLTGHREVISASEVTYRPKHYNVCRV